MTRAGQVAVVAGGSSGIGAATARMLAEAGADVAITYHSEQERADRLIGSLPAGRHVALPLALEQTASIAAFAAEIERRFDSVEALVISAGTTRVVAHTDLDALDDQLIDNILRVNVAGPLALIRAFVPMLRRSGRGVIVTISSVSAFTAHGSNIAYCGSKAAMDTITVGLARALGPEIRVLSVSPGPVATDFLPGRDRKTLERMAATTPLRRVVEPEDVARAVLACTSLLTASTGIRIVVDGGSSIA